MWVPPEAYLDEAHNPADAVALGNGESTWSGLRVRVKGVSVGRRPFNLRRPPIVLVHGLFGAADNYWGEYAYNEAEGRPLPTRLYFADYPETNRAGYDTNFGVVPWTIRHAMVDYWTANDDPQRQYGVSATNGNGAARTTTRKFAGIRHAATRADVVGHSMGGQNTRFYLGGFTGSVPRRHLFGTVVAGAVHVTASPRPWPWLLEVSFAVGDARTLSTPDANPHGIQVRPPTLAAGTHQPHPPAVSRVRDHRQGDPFAGVVGLVSGPHVDRVKGPQVRPVSLRPPA